MPLENEYGALALDSTLDALKTVTDGLLLAASAIQVATEALNVKAVTLDTAHVAGSVDIDNFPVTQPVSGTVAVSNMVSQGLTDAQLRATALPVSGPLTDTQIRATALPVSGTVAVNNQPSQPLTDTQLRAADVKITLDSEQISIANFPGTQPVSGTVSVSNMISQGLTDTQLRATAIPVSGPLTDTQIRATALPVSGTVAISNQLTQPLTDAQIRATALPVLVSNSNLAAEESIQELQAIEQRIKALNVNIQRLSFDATSQLRVLVSSLPTLSTVTTVGTVTTGNIGFGDCGKTSAAILTSRQAFHVGIGANFIRS